MGLLHAGRAWTAQDLRGKSWDDLHKLWWVTTLARCTRPPRSAASVTAAGTASSLTMIPCGCFVLCSPLKRLLLLWSQVRAAEGAQHAAHREAACSLGWPEAPEPLPPAEGELERHRFCTFLQLQRCCKCSPAVTGHFTGAPRCSLRTPPGTARPTHCSCVCILALFLTHGINCTCHHAAAHLHRIVRQFPMPASPQVRRGMARIKHVLNERALAEPDAYKSAELKRFIDAI